MVSRLKFILIAAIFFTPYANAAPVITLSADKFSPSESIIVKVTNLPGNPQDWLTLVKVSAPASKFGEWFYTKGVTEGTWTFSAPKRPGDYEVRVFFDYPSGGETIHARAAVKVIAKVKSQPQATVQAAKPESKTAPTMTLEQSQNVSNSIAKLNAQSPQNLRKKTQATLSIDPAAIQKDADKLYQYCLSQALYAAFNECGCVRDRYIQDRQQNRVQYTDPIQATSQIPANACPNASGIKTYVYQKCGRDYVNRIRSGLEEFCSCYSEELVKTQMQQPRRPGSALMNYGAGAISTCDAKGLPSPVHPNRTVAGSSVATDPGAALDADGFEPLPTGFCKPEGRQRHQIDRYRACQAAKNPEQFNASNPGYEINVKYQRCLYTGLKNEQNSYLVQQDCEKRYGLHWIKIDNP